MPSEEQDSPPKPTSSELDIVEDDEDYLDIWVYR